MSFNYKNLTNTITNVGEKEKKIRLIVGSASLLISIFFASIPLLIIGVVLIATGYSRVCPAYSALEINTCDNTAEIKTETKPTVAASKKPATTQTKSATTKKTTTTTKPAAAKKTTTTKKSTSKKEK